MCRLFKTLIKSHLWFARTRVWKGCHSLWIGSTHRKKMSLSPSPFIVNNLFAVLSVSACVSIAPTDSDHYIHSVPLSPGVCISYLSPAPLSPLSAGFYKGRYIWECYSDVNGSVGAARWQRYRYTWNFYHPICASTWLPPWSVDFKTDLYARWVLLSSSFFSSLFCSEKGSCCLPGPATCEPRAKLRCRTVAMFGLLRNSERRMQIHGETRNRVILWRAEDQSFASHIRQRT